MEMNIRYYMCLFLFSYLLYYITNKNKKIIYYLSCNIPFGFINGYYSIYTRFIFLIFLLLFSIFPMLICILFNYIAKKNGYDINENGTIKKNGVLYLGKYNKIFYCLSVSGWFSVFTLPFILFVPHIFLL